MRKKGEDIREEQVRANDAMKRVKVAGLEAEFLQKEEEAMRE